MEGKTVKLQGNVLIAQGGGPTVVINQTLAGLVLEARKFAQASRIYGALHGVKGILNEDFVDLSRETPTNLERVARTPSSALLSTRDKPDHEYCRKMFEVMKAHDIRYFFYVGGNDSADSVRIVSNFAREARYDMRSIHVPKTIDNDLAENDHCPGYGSAARFVSLAFMGVNQDTRALPGVYIAIVMGRNAGFLTASSAIGQASPEDGPHLVYLPERKFSTDRFLADVNATFKERGRCIAAISEGVTDESGTPILAKLTGGEKDAHGNVQLSGTGALGDLLAEHVRSKLGIKRVRSDTFGYLQRSFPGCVSDRDAQEAREAGERAVQLAMWEEKDGSVAIRRPVLDYAVEYELVPLENVAAKTRTMPDDFINAAGNGVTAAFRAYARPLVGSDFPEAHRLHAPRVEKKMKK